MLNNNRSLKKSLETGFTVVELLVIAPIVLLTIGAFITVIVNMTGDVLASRASSVFTYNIQDALNRIEDDVKLSSTFLAQTNIQPSSPQGYNNDATSFYNVDSAKGNMLILNSLATTDSPLLATSGLVYLSNLPNSCTSTQVNQNKPMTYNVVYFVKGSSLWRRVIMNPTYLTDGCSVPWQQPSCAPNISGTLCKTEDTKLADNITTSDFVVQYFNAPNATTANTVASDTTCSPNPTDPTCVATRNTALQSLSTVGVSINLNGLAAGRQISQSGSIRATKLDINASSIAAVSPTTAPDVPSGVTATFTTPGQIAVSWNPNADTYNLQYDTTTSFSSPTTISNLTTSNRTVTGLSSSPIYYFRVQSSNSAGTSAWSSAVGSNSTITNGLVVWWPFNGNANDSSGGGYNGTVVGAALTTGQKGLANTAYNFTASVNTITSSTIPTMNTRLTLSAWIKPSSTPAERYTIMEGITPAGAYYLSMNTDKSIQLYWYSTSVEGYHSSGANTITLNAWSYVVGTWDGTNARIYVNGVLKNTVAVTGAGRAASQLIVGAESPSRQYIGAMDDVREYNRALSDSEVLSLYNDGAR